MKEIMNKKYSIKLSADKRSVVASDPILCARLIIVLSEKGHFINQSEGGRLYLDNPIELDELDDIIREQFNYSVIEVGHEHDEVAD